jgi:hypothetical protein
MRDEKCRDMENVGANRKGAEDETVRGGLDKSVNPFERTPSNRLKHGPGFPGREWGEDRDADSDGDYDD